MIVSFNQQSLADLYAIPIKQLGKIKMPKEVIIGFKKRIDIFKNAPDLRTIAQIRSLNLEKLKDKEYEGCYSVRVNDKYRIIFTEGSAGEVSVLILELSNHYD